MYDVFASLSTALLSAVAMAAGGLMLLGIPLALFEGMFGRGGIRPGGGVYRNDRSSQELFERRLRDSHRR